MFFLMGNPLLNSNFLKKWKKMEQFGILKFMRNPLQNPHFLTVMGGAFFSPIPLPTKFVVFPSFSSFFLQLSWEILCIFVFFRYFFFMRNPLYFSPFFTSFSNIFGHKNLFSGKLGERLWGKHKILGEILC